MKKLEPNLEKQRQMPLVIFQSVRGPIIGRAQTLNARTTRLYAPAHVGSPAPGKVMFMPLLFCEEYIDINVDAAAFFGTHPVPDVIAQGYESYFNEFNAGSYKMQPLLVEAGVHGAPVEVDDLHVSHATPVEPPPEKKRPCGSCGHAMHLDKAKCGEWISSLPQGDVDAAVDVGNYCPCTAGAPTLPHVCPVDDCCKH